MRQVNILRGIVLVSVLGLVACNSQVVTPSVLSTPVWGTPTIMAQTTPTQMPTVTSSLVPIETSTLTPMPRPTTTPCPASTLGGPTGQIIFSAVTCYNEACQPSPGEVSSIYLINSDGSGIQQIYEGLGVIGDLQLSPDGTKLAFTDNYGRGTSNVYVLDLASGNAWPLMPDDTVQRAWGPRWVFDDQLVYVSKATEPANSPANIYLASINGTWHQALTDRSVDRTYNIGNIAISPNGSQLLFAEFLHDRTATVVYHVILEGNRIEELMTFPGMPNAYAQWSPTGDCLIAYADPMGFAEYAPVYIGRSDGKGMIEIATLPGRDSLDLLGWTEYPDGSLFYVCNHSLGISQIVEVQSDGSVRALAQVEIPEIPLDTTWCVFGSLSPDRQLFAFVPLLPFGARNLYVTDLSPNGCSYQILSGYSVQSITWPAISIFLEPK